MSFNFVAAVTLCSVILEPKKIKSVAASMVSPSICHEVVGLDAIILIFCMLNFKPAFSFSSFILIKRLFSASSLYAIKSGIVCKAEVVDISPSNLDSSLGFIQPYISRDILCI